MYKTDKPDSPELKKAETVFEKLGGGIKLCEKLTELEKNWADIVGAALAEQTCPANCEFSREGLIITVNVTERSLVNALKFKRGAIKNKIQSFMKLPILDVAIEAGRVTKKSAAKPARPAYERRAPLILDEKTVYEQTEFLYGCTGDIRVAEQLARIKTSIEKINSRKR